MYKPKTQRLFSCAVFLNLSCPSTLGEGHDREEGERESSQKESVLQDVYVAMCDLRVPLKVWTVDCMYRVAALNIGFINL